MTVALSYEEIGKHAERITKIKPFINKCKWEGINFPYWKKWLEKSEKNNVTINLNVFLCLKEQVYLAYVSKNNSDCEEKVILLMILIGEKWKAKYEGCVAKSEDDDGIILQ